MSTVSDDHFWYHRRAQDCIAQGYLTNSKRPESLIKGIYPTHLKKGKGCHVWDHNGNKYLDFICGLGTNLLGYAEEEVTQAICDQALKGASLSLATDLEIECAEKVKEMFPFASHVKFLKTGTEACMAAVKIARAYSDTKWVSSEGYHGWSDEFVWLTPPALGVKEQLSVQKTYSPHNINITEPVMTDISRDRYELLHKNIKDSPITIYDEVITGFRFPQHSVSKYWGLEPDIICLGKAISNGMPLAVVAGKEKVMNCGEYFISSTYAGEALSLASAIKTMTLLQTKYDVQVLWDKGQKFLKDFNSIWDEVQIEGYPTRGVFKAKPETKAIFFQECCRAGILFGPSWFFNFPLMEYTGQVLNTCSDIVTRMKTGMVKLEGELPKSPFAQKARGNG